MKIEKDKVVRLQIEISDLWGNLLERSDDDEPLQYLHGGYDGIVPGVEAALEGKEVGASLSLRLEPEEAFGEYDEELVRVESRDRFPETLEVGMQFEGVPGEDVDDAMIYTITDIAAGAVVLDGNHPYAGIALEFKCKVLDVRAATAVELEQGHAEDLDDLPVRIIKH
ncbi:MAG TPA: peptidylprolyl isomerase [Burkholderiales bacterium]|nr:peptidylprolyl isomerase [Burkholderiales bacterium]